MRSSSPVDRSGVDCTLYWRPMPSTEAPTSPPGRPPEPFSRRKRVRYEELDPDELLHLIDRLEDERSRALRREGIWISLIAHLLLFWFLIYGPRFRSHQPHVVNPNDNKKDLTYLNLPPDAQKEVKPKPKAPLSDKNRVAQSAHPTLDRKTLRQLEAMKKAGPPIPVAPPQAAPQPAPPTPVPRNRHRLDRRLRRPHPLSNRCSMSLSRPPLHRPGPASTAGRRTRGMRFARQNGMPPKIPAASLAITGKTRPPNIQPWVLARKFSATPWGLISAPTCGG